MSLNTKKNDLDGKEREEYSDTGAETRAGAGNPDAGAGSQIVQNTTTKTETKPLFFQALESTKDIPIIGSIVSGISYISDFIYNYITDLLDLFNISKLFSRLFE